jgi:4-hydroxy-4-methyl-2-oxoglutarate aldolase
MDSNRYEYGGVPVTDLIARFAKVYSGAVYDALEHMGFPYQALAQDIKPIRPDMIIAGPAFTIKGIPSPNPDPNLLERRIRFFAEMKDLGLPVIDTRDCSFDTQVAHYGELNAALGKSCGAVGALVDGGCRDTGMLLKRNFPVCCRYQTPVEAFGRWTYAEWQIPIGLRGAISSIVTVNPGDFIFADLDGAIVIPHDVVCPVLERAEKFVDTEGKERAEFFADGSDPIAVYRKYGRL